MLQLNVLIFVACMQDMTEFAIMRSHLRIMTTEVYVILKTCTACKLTRLVPIVPFICRFIETGGLMVY